MHTLNEDVATKNVVHFDPQGNGAFWPLKPVCGEHTGKRNAGAPIVSVDPSKVTCRRCKKTKVYKEAMKCFFPLNF